MVGTWKRWPPQPGPQELSFVAEQTWRRERRVARATSTLTAAVLPAFREVGEYVRRLGRQAEIIHAPVATWATFRVFRDGALELDYTILVTADDTPTVRVRHRLVHLGRHAPAVDAPPLLSAGERPDALTVDRVREHLVDVVNARVRAREASLLGDRPPIPLPLTTPAREPSPRR